LAEQVVEGVAHFLVEGLRHLADGDVRRFHLAKFGVVDLVEFRHDVVLEGLVSHFLHHYFSKTEFLVVLLNHVLPAFGVAVDEFLDFR